MIDNFGIDSVKFGDNLSILKVPAEMPGNPSEFGVLWEAKLIGICRSDKDHVSETERCGNTKHLIHEIVGEVLMMGTRVPKNIKIGTVVAPLVRRRCEKADTPDLRCEPHVCAMRGRQYRSLTDQGCRKYSLDNYWNLTVVPEELAHDEISVLAEPMGLINKAISEILKIKPSWSQNSKIPPRALICGLGIGLLMAFVLKLKGFNVIVLDNEPSGSRRHDLARVFRIPHIKVDVDEEVGPQLVSLGIADSFDLVVDATGRSKALENLLQLVGSKGVALAFSLPPDTWIEKVCRNNVTIVGSSKMLEDDECLTEANRVCQLRVGKSRCVGTVSQDIVIYKTSGPDVLISRDADNADLETHIKELSPNSVVFVMGGRSGWTSLVVARDITVLGCVNYGAIHSNGGWSDLLELRQAVMGSRDLLLAFYADNEIEKAFADRDAVRAVVRI